MTYYKKLETFEDWNLHYNFIISNFLDNEKILKALDIVEENILEKLIFKKKRLIDMLGILMKRQKI